MGNIIKSNEKLESFLNFIEGWGCAAFILIGIIGCNVKESGGATFGWSFTIFGILLSLFMSFCIYQLNKSGGALTKRILFEKDLEGLTMEDLERLRNHIYARHGYNFNVNEGLDYLPNLYQRLQSLFPDNAVNIKESELHTYSRKLECHEEQLIMVLEASEQVCPTSPQRVPIELLTEEERNTFREKLENCDFNSVKNHFYHFSFKIGSFDRNGVYGHEGVHYYDYKKSSWYKPTTNKLEEVYSKMSEIEKYNIDLIKAYEEKL